MLYKTTVGNPQNPPIVLIHGFMGSSEDLMPLALSLSKQMYCHLIDLPGHGKSQACYFESAKEFDALILETLQGWLPKSAAVLGYSLGGRVSLRLSGNLCPKQLILLSSAVDNLSNKEILARIDWEAKTSNEMLRLSAVDFYRTWYSQPLFGSLKHKQALFNALVSSRSSILPHKYIPLLPLLSPRNYVLKNSIHKISIPTLYCYGNEDKKYQSMAKNILKNNNSVWVSGFSGCSHALHLEAPSQIATSIHQFYRYYHDRVEKHTPV